MPNFRSDYLSDWKWKLVDATGHVVFGVLIWKYFWIRYTPWVILFQWLPDIFLYPRWLYGIWTKKYVSETNIWREAHLFIHSPTGLIISSIVFLANPIIGANMATHLLWDLYTHQKLELHQR